VCQLAVVAGYCGFAERVDEAVLFRVSLCEWGGYPARTFQYPLNGFVVKHASAKDGYEQVIVFSIIAEAGYAVGGKSCEEIIFYESGRVFSGVLGEVHVFVKDEAVVDYQVVSLLNGLSGAQVYWRFCRVSL